MSNTKIKKSKNIFFSLVLCFAMMLSALVGINLTPKITVSASSDYIQKDVSSDLLSNYHNFYTTSTAKPATPSGWSEISDNAVNKDNIIKGIVDVTDETTFKTSTYKTTRPTMPLDKDSDNAYFKNLMINSPNGAGRFGYKSNSISLEANSFYEIRVKLYTHRTEKSDDFEETDPTASIYLTGLTTDEKYDSQVKFENINTLTTWENYSFYIDTNSSATVNLELWLGSKTTSIQGAVFFNNVKIIRYSEDYYSKYILSKNDTEVDNFNIIYLSPTYTEPVTNSSFETTTPMGWSNIAKSSTDADTQICEIIDANNYSLTVDENTKISAPGSNNSASNSHALFMYNKEDGYQAIESSKIKIEPLTFSKITFYAKSDCNVGSGATVMLVDKSTTNAIDSASLTLATTYTKNSNTYRNDWTKYSFYIYGNENETKEVTIQIWLGTNSNKTSGYVFVDDFRMEEISYEDYSNNSSSTNASALNFNSTSDSFVIVNSDFNKTSNEDSSTKYPLAPTNWTKKGNSNSSTFSGVIKTDKTHFENNLNNYTNGLITPTRPANHPVYKDTNNVLMIGSTSENNTQTYESSSISLSASSYYKLSFYVFTDYSKVDNTNNLGASVSLKTSTKTLFEYFNINYTDNNWHQFVVYLKTGVNSETANLNLTFDGLTGYVFFDDIRLETTNEEVFGNFTKLPEINYTKIDLSTENFDNRSFNNNSNIQTPNNWTSSEQDDLSVTNSGIINLTKNGIENINSTLSSNSNALFIQSLHDVNYGFTTSEEYSFSAKTYYKITVNVLTKNILSENAKDDIVYGARISLNNSKDILVKGINTLSGWKTYTIYLSLENSLTSKITLALGSEDEKVSGLVLFDQLDIKTIDQDTLLDELKTANEDTTFSFINYTEETEEPTDENNWSNEFNWLIIPSLLTGLAIIIAVIGFYAKKIKFTRKPKIKTKYDRRKTLDKDIDRKERIALRRQIIEELNAELVSIDEEIEAYNKLAEEQLEVLKNKILAEKEEIKRQKLDLEIRKKEATSQREKQLKENPELVSDTKAEKEYIKFMEKLDKQEMHLQKQLQLKDIKIENTKEVDKSKLAKYLERKEFIKNEIAKIEAEIEEIAKEEAEMWEEYKQAKLEAKQRKAEIKEQQKAEKTANSNKKEVNSNKKTSTKNTKETKVKDDTSKETSDTQNTNTTSDETKSNDNQSNN